MGVMLRPLLLSAVCLCAAPAVARAVPGPDSVVVIGNASVAESVALARRYAAARRVPDRQVCLLDVADTEDISLDAYRATFLSPLEACLDAGGVTDRIEAALLVRGVPLRVIIPTAGGDRSVSLAAALGVWRSERDGEPILGTPPGRMTMGVYAAFYNNPFRGGVFSPGYDVELLGVRWRPLLVTMLHARTYEDAGRLLDSALEAESGAPPAGQFLFMNGRDGARGVLDREYDGVIGALAARGYADAERVAFETDLSGRTLAAFFTGTASLGDAIEANTYLPGSLVDNLTSFGAVPPNFRESGEEQQVSIARWVEQGVAGVHGTTAEPLNGVFPSRYLIVDYVDGSTLAEAYHRRLPNVYWHNLVLGDPMAAPYAVRPVITVDGAADRATLAGATPITLTADDPAGRGVAWIAAFVDGEEVARADGDTLTHCLVPPAGPSTVLVVAQAAEDPTDARPFQPKGWVSLQVTGADGPSTCAEPTDDAGAGDTDAGAGRDAGVRDDGGAAVDAGPPEGGGGGCACRAAPSGAGPAIFLALLGLAASRRLRRQGR